jgi:D-alanyl-D-alanine carboxypeptidase (penicillin-binding protein 5/6)
MSNIFSKKESETSFSLIFSVAAIFLVLALFALETSVKRDDASMPTLITTHEFPTVSLSAKSAYVYDLREDKEIFALEADERLPLASITKLMSALVALDLSPTYGTVTITPSALAVYGDSGFRPQEKWSLKNLLDFSLLTSSNDGMHAVALSLASLNSTVATEEEIVESFVREMNAKASELGLQNTYFWNETGLDESEAKGGAYGSARDISALIGHILITYPETLEATQEAETSVTAFDNTPRVAKNTNTLVNEIPGILASKTGFTDIAGGNLTFVFDPELGRPFVVTILGSTAEGRFEDARKLVAATMEYVVGTEVNDNQN